MVYKKEPKRFDKNKTDRNGPDRYYAVTCGMDGFDTIEKITPKVIDDTFTVNVRGSFLMTKELIRNCEDYGSIINISTDSSQVFENQITYGASKAALEALTRSISIEIRIY